MADTKISDLSDGGAVQSTDKIPAVRGSGNVRVAGIESTTGAQAKADAARDAAVGTAATDATNKANTAQSAAATDATTKANAAQAAAIATAAADATSKANAAAAASIPLSQKGAADGVAPLDSASKIPSLYLPGFVDDVLEFANLAALPATGEAGKIYVTLDNNRQYRWSGSAYVEINPSPGSTDAVPEGSVNLYHAPSRVRAVALTGIDVLTAGAITAADTVLSALGKLAALVAGKADSNDARLSDSREWSAATVGQTEAEEGTVQTRRAWTAQRVAQAIAAQVAVWWNALSTAAGRALVTAADASAQRTALGLGTAATTASSAYATAAQGTKADGAAQIAGDLSGTAATPVVAKINGVAVTGTPTTGQVPTATSGTAATWQTPSGGGGSPGGSSGQFQYNNAGAFAGTSAITTNGVSIIFGSTGWSTPRLYESGYTNLGWATSSGNWYFVTSASSGAGIFGLHGGDNAAHIYTKLGFGTGVPSASVYMQTTAGLSSAVEVNNGTAGTFRDIKLRRLIATEGMQLTAATVGTLPAAASNIYLASVVTDASAPTVGATVASGGSAKAVVRSNGTNYIVTEVL